MRSRSALIALVIAAGLSPAPPRTAAAAVPLPTALPTAAPAPAAPAPAALSAAVLPGGWLGPCVPTAGSPRCRFWPGTVTHVADGDTLDIRIDGMRVPVRVRITGIQAMEQSVYSRVPARRRGECHSLMATARLEQLVRAGGRRVQVSAQNPASGSRDRLRRSVRVRLGGHWQDVGQVLVREGQALWMSTPTEYAWNPYYNVAAQRAAARSLRLWNPRFCGLGPSEGLPVKVEVQWNAEGREATNLNGEWIRIWNRAARLLPLGGWWVRDSGLRRYRFPARTVIPPGRPLTVHTGRGRNTGYDLYWGLGAPVFDNVSGRPVFSGDGGYLFDPQGDVRASMNYPCAVRCADALAGQVVLGVHPRGGEYATVRNVSRRAFDLEGYVLDSGFYNYAFGHVAVYPGETLVLDAGPGVDTRLRKHWGKRRTVLGDIAGALRLRTYTNVVVACVAWGRPFCRLGGAGPALRRQTMGGRPAAVMRRTVRQ